MIPSLIINGIRHTTNTDLVHPTWLTNTISVIYVSNILSMRPCMMLILLVVEVFVVTQ